MANLNRLDDAITLFQYVLVRDPVNSAALTALASNYHYAGLPDLALEYARRSVQLSPGGIQAFAIISLALLQKGQLEDALEATTKESFEGWRLISSAMIYYEMGRQADSDAVLAELIDKYEQVAAYNIAYVFAYRGEHDLAFEWLDKAVHYNDSGFVGIATQSEFANIYDHPRWLPFLEGIGKSPAQLAAIEFNVQLSVVAGQ